ncbi:WecB/TagA/CpsF family glycosyltransferase [Baekduia soli]|uniref:WecB/TagA/CpsF family glycosyltransferase n=2 Tax=Baekduia soli TaxID=496014 RepID=A0A5B8UBU6_9ACTN|nr:WecB/TagA/CpsF family glycosyltransferase [Baekduia soli]
MGVRVDAVTEEQAIEEVLEASASRAGGFLCTVNLDILRQCRQDRELHDLVSSADIRVADGMPLIWASHIAGTPLPERVAGSSLVWTLPEAAARDGASVFLLGGNEGVAEEAAHTIVERHPRLRVAGTHCPPLGFEHSPRQTELIEERLRRARPDIVFVALGSPKEQRLIARLQPLFPQIWFVNCGISFSFVTGEVQRSPGTLQRVGLEWLWRLIQEPRRLARRYLVDGPPAFATLVTSAARTRLARRAGRGSVRQPPRR